MPLISIFFFNDTATTEIYTLSLHDALPICPARRHNRKLQPFNSRDCAAASGVRPRQWLTLIRVRALHFNKRSEEHTSELQSQSNLVCRLLLEKKKNTPYSRLLSHWTRRYTS